ncbi:hypothetical protein M2317_001390 [Microbacterium sp. ZKA21]|uniref:hypothetical protein n=1 Tax=Microbacterium sp. ZKA21 TaxID=3381694 RepID=UPI003D1D175A
MTASEARMLGHDVSSPRWQRVRHGIYVDRVAFEELPPWRKYAVRVHAFARMHPDAVLCLESAAVVLGLPLFDEARDIHVYDPDRGSSRRFGDVCVHTSADPRQVVQVDGVFVTGLLDTTIDLARVLPPAFSLAVVDAAIAPAQGGTLTAATLQEHASAQQNQRGAVQLRWLWAHADPRSESSGESLSRAVIAWCGFPAPVPQATFHYDGCTDRVDFLFEDTKTIGESDGWGKYKMEQDPTRAAELLKDEKRREDRLRRRGHPFARWELKDVFRVTPLGDALHAASVQRVRPSEPGMLATLRDRRRQAQRSGR